MIRCKLFGCKFTILVDITILQNKDGTKKIKKYRCERCGTLHKVEEAI